MKLTTLDHIVLCVTDVARSIAFYEQTLGMRPREERPGKWSLHFGAHKISLQDARTVPEIARATVPGSGNYCVLTDEPIERVAAMLRERGVEIVDGPGEREGAAGRISSIYIRDPDGNLVEISNLLAPRETRPIEYRAARPSDAEAIANLHARSWRENYRGSYDDAFLDGDLPAERLRVWRERLDRPAENQFVELAFADGELAAFVCAYGAQDPDWGSLIDNLHVARSFKGAGVGATLMRRAGAWLASRYADDAVHLLVLEVNTAARRFYERLGGRNAQVSMMETHGGAHVRSCRYVWTIPGELAAPSIEWLGQSEYWARFDAEYRPQTRWLDETIQIHASLAELRARIARAPVFTPTEEDFPGPVERWYGVVFGHLFLLTHHYEQSGTLTMVTVEPTPDARDTVLPAIERCIAWNPYEGRS